MAEISKVSVKLSGVKTTLNKLAVRPEFSWHVLRDFDSINRTAEALERRERREVRKTKGERSIGDLMLPPVYCIVSYCSDGCRQGVDVGRDAIPGQPIRSRTRVSPVPGDGQ